ncbi:MAG: hypothetical protein R3211_09745, partial [Balneolaceae bacterium]|nr:hypothetical protein [Balneolaceae bacterium]
HLWYIPVVLAAVLLNYAIIYSFKHRFLRIIEKRFKIIVFSLVFLLVGTFQAIALILRNPGWFLENYLPDFETVMTVLSYAPGGLLVTSAVHEYDLLTGTVAYSFCAALIFLIFRDHYFKTKEGLHAPVRKETGESKNRLWPFLKRWLGNNAGKFYFYVLIHPYNRLFLLTVVLIPMVYIPLLLRLQNNFFAAILIPTMLAAIPVALLAMGMANMYGYEHSEFLVHRQFPTSFEKQLKERFLGIITVPLFIFYLITIGEIIFLPELGPVFDIYISNTFYFLCFMLVFLWTSFYYYQKASYSSFSFKHPIVPQKVTFIMTFLMFGLGYAVFAPVGDLQIYRLWVMSGLILAIVVYLWLNMNVLVKAFDRKILPELWYGTVE